jgi:hypothetical protein
MKGAIMTASVLVLLLAIGGCAAQTSTTTLITTAATLDAVGKNFDAAGRAFTAGCTATPPTIKKADCDTFRRYGQKFKATYPMAVNLWKAAGDANDPAIQNDARAAVTKLSSELIAIAAQANVTFGGVAR